MNKPWKRYAMFTHDEYYPSGARKDFVGTFDTIDEATAWCHAAKYWEIRERVLLVDTQTGEWSEGCEYTSFAWEPPKDE